MKGTDKTHDISKDVDHYGKVRWSARGFGERASLPDTGMRPAENFRRNRGCIVIRVSRYMEDEKDEWVGLSPLICICVQNMRTSYVMI